jgi:flagellin
LANIIYYNKNNGKDASKIQGGIIMIINHNMMAMNTHRQMAGVGGAQSKSMEKLSSGYRINRAGDDAAGLAISEKMRAQVRGLNQASRNAQDGISLIQTAEGALTETHSMLQRMRELAVQANNGTNTSDDLAEIQKEITELNKEITRVAEKTEFNTQTLLKGTLGVKAADGTGTLATWNNAGINVDTSGVATGETLTFTVDAANDKLTIAGTNSGKSQTVALGSAEDAVAKGTVLNFDALGVTVRFDAVADLTAVDGGIDTKTLTTTGNALNFQIGANTGTTLSISIGDMSATGLGKTNGGSLTDVNDVNVTTQTFDDNIKAIDKAIKDVSAQRSQLGAFQNRLEHTIRNLDTSAENLQSAESRVRDVDMAKEMMAFTKNNILQQAAQSMLAQANQAPQGVLQLLR